MERAIEPHLIEEAKKILKKYCTDLSLESISIFSKDGTFFYSSDSSIDQPDDLPPLFTLLKDLTYDFIIGVPCALIVQDYSKCLILKPIYLGVWGKIEGWYLAYGSCLELKCRDLSENLRNQAEQDFKDYLSGELETKENRERLRMVFDLPRIIGKEFEKNDDTVITIDGEDGIVIQRYEQSPWGISTSSSRFLPPLLRGLDDMDEYIASKAWRILESDPHQKPRKKSDFTRSNKLIKIIIAYSVLTLFPFLIVDREFLLELVTTLVFFNLFLLLIVTINKRGGMRNDCICPCLLFLIGTTMTVVAISQMVLNFDTMTLFGLLLGIYSLIAGILFTVVRWEREGVLNDTKEDDDSYVESASSEA